PAASQGCRSPAPAWLKALPESLPIESMLNIRDTSNPPPSAKYLRPDRAILATVHARVCFQRDSMGVSAYLYQRSRITTILLVCSLLQRSLGHQPIPYARPSPR